MPYPLATLAASLSDARAKRVAQKRLRDELTSFSSPNERAELDAILERHNPEVRELLARQAGLRSVA